MNPSPFQEVQAHVCVYRFSTRQKRMRELETEMKTPGSCGIVDRERRTKVVQSFFFDVEGVKDSLVCHSFVCTAVHV